MDGTLYHDGSGRRHCLGQGALPPLGKDGIVPFRVSAIAQRRLEHCFLRIKGTALGPFRNYCPGHCAILDHKMVQGSEQNRRLAARTLPLVGVLCHRSEL